MLQLQCSSSNLFCLCHSAFALFHFRHQKSVAAAMVEGIALNLVILIFKTCAWAGLGRRGHVQQCNLYNAVKQSGSPTQVARYAMMSIVRTLLLAALAFAVMQVPVSAGTPGGRNASVRAVGCRFVCAHLSTTGMLFSRGLFLHRAAVLRHIAASFLSNACRAAKEGIRTIPGRRRHGRGGWRGGPRAGCPTPAAR